MPHKKGLRIGLTILSILAAVMSMPMVMFSPMMFDAPGSENNPVTQLLFYSVLAFPVLCLMGGILPWIFKRHPKSIWLYGLSGLAIGLLILAIVLLSIKCGGDFAC
jgi:glucan phosphoethanolaminetransferase (alkaline phosphatase superfamily)